MLQHSEVKIDIITIIILTHTLVNSTHGMAQTHYKISNATAVMETLATLTNCSASVGEGCRVPALDTTTLASCQSSLQTVEDKNKECYELLTKTSAVSNILFISDIICKCKM